jgi:hypothetical protein
VMCLCSLVKFLRKRSSLIPIERVILSTVAMPDLASHVYLAQLCAHGQFEQQHNQPQDYSFGN